MYWYMIHTPAVPFLNDCWILFVLYITCLYLFTTGIVPHANAKLVSTATSSETETEADHVADTEERKEFEKVLLAGSNCVFVNYDGAVIPW